MRRYPGLKILFSYFILQCFNSPASNPHENALKLVSDNSVLAPGTMNNNNKPHAIHSIAEILLRFSLIEISIPRKPPLVFRRTIHIYVSIIYRFIIRSIAPRIEKRINSFG
ncbi:MAG TPA: hypothetical protein DEO84_05025 [candidate division Zixibacteria bacterium]|nr:hypothetical protein [candidate division Zixibacteria bacterium]